MEDNQAVWSGRLRSRRKDLKPSTTDIKLAKAQINRTDTPISKPIGISKRERRGKAKRPLIVKDSVAVVASLQMTDEARVSHAAVSSLHDSLPHTSPESFTSSETREASSRRPLASSHCHDPTRPRTEFPCWQTRPYQSKTKDSVVGRTRSETTSPPPHATFIGVRSLLTVPPSHPNQQSKRLPPLSYLLEYM